MQPVLLRNAQEIFLEAMCSGYAMNGGRSAEKTTIVELPRSKVITYNHGEWKVVDCYFKSTHSERSVGHTTVWHREEPVWFMSYGGWYATIAIPFLKKCLQRAYLEQRFYGGRGPEFVQEDQFTYVNRFHGTFSDFKGEERIYDRSETRFGRHWYHGMSLLK